MFSTLSRTSYIAGPGTRYDQVTFIDLVTSADITYILCSSSIQTYFILSLNASGVIAQFDLATFDVTLTNLGHIVSFNNHIYVLIYNPGSCTVVGDRISNSSPSSPGILFTIRDTTVLSYRRLSLTQNFLLFGQDWLYLAYIDTNILQRFNPATSPSWTIPIQNALIDGCTVPDMVILLYSTYFQGFDNFGTILWTSTLANPNAKSCTSYNFTLYIASIVPQVYISQWAIGATGPTLISNTQSTSNNVELVFVASLDTDKYIVATEFSLDVYSNDTTLITHFDLGSVMPQFIYRLIPRNTNIYCTVIINGIIPITVNTQPYFEGTGSYAGFFDILPTPMIMNSFTNYTYLQHTTHNHMIYKSQTSNYRSKS